jgi:hypothetical protein
MSAKEVREPSGVRSAYENFLEAFRDAVEFAGGHVTIPDVPLPSCFTLSGNGTSVAFSRCLYVKKLACRKLSGNKRLDVVVKALEEITKDSWSLTKSTVYLNYFVVTKDSALLAQSLHFDFVEAGQPGHPFFHLQLTDEPIPQDDLEKTGFSLQLKLPEQPNECWVTTRIPTPDMTLASVLYCLVADHFAEFFEPFAERVASIQDGLPPASFDPLKSSLQKSFEHFKSSHWFAHMRKPTQQNS